MFVELKSGHSTINLNHFFEVSIRQEGGQWKIKAFRINRIRPNDSLPAIIAEYDNKELAEEAYNDLMQAIADNKGFWSPHAND